jgi:hypothetical protein
MVPAVVFFEGPHFLHAGSSRGRHGSKRARRLEATSRPWVSQTRRQGSRQTTVDSKYLPRDVFAGVARKQDRCTLQVLVVADSTQWC